MYVKTVLLTLMAWFLGLLLDANLDMKPQGFLYLRVLLPILVMGLCILSRLPGATVQKDSAINKDTSGDSPRAS